MTNITLPLSQLHFGRDAEPPINVRRTGRQDGIEALASSIANHGLIHALIVRGLGGRWFVVDGDRRLAALKLLVERGELDADAPIQCVEDNDSDALEISLAANVMSMPMHEADQLEAFRELSDAGLDDKAIASRFGIEPARVRRILALGRLSPVILDAWRSGEFNDRNPALVVRAFTMASDHEAQERVYKKLSSEGRMMAHWIRSEFGAGSRDVERLMKFVGKDAYIAAGGSITEDLFGDDHVVSDRELLERVAAEKLQEKIAELKADGWSWVASSEELPHEWSWSWTKSKDGKKHTAKDKLEAGAVVRLDHNGELEVTLGVVRPQKAAAKTTTNEKGDTVPAPATISNALHHRLSIAATMATRSALRDDPRLGLVALLAGFLTRSGSYDSVQDAPIRVSHEGYAKPTIDPHGREQFGPALARLSAMTDEELFKAAAGIAGAALSVETPYTGAMPFTSGAGALAEAIRPDKLQAALLDAFDAEDYFGSAPKPIALAAIREALGEEEASIAGKLKKAELVEFATERLQPTGWLPPELRTRDYVGHGVAKPKRRAKAKA